jgi:hypothetical protein
LVPLRSVVYKKEGIPSRVELAPGPLDPDIYPAAIVARPIKIIDFN